MKRIYILDEAVSSQRNGIGTFLSQLIDCCKKGNEITLVSFNADVKEFALTSIGHGIKQMCFPPFPGGGFTQHGDIVSLFFKMYIEDTSDNVFIVNHSPCSELLAAIRQTLPLSKIVFIIHDLGWTSLLLGDMERYKKIIRRRNHAGIRQKYSMLLERYEEDKKIYDTADRVICLSEDTQALLTETYRVEPFKIVRCVNGLKDAKRTIADIVEVRKELLIGTDEQILLFVGRSTRQKGAYALLKAFEKVVAKQKNVRLVIAGSGNFEDLLKKHSPIAHRITFTGLLDKELLYKWYAVADIGILPSYNEQCSYTGIEMMMHGLPVIATDGYGARNMFQDGRNARIASIHSYRKEDVFVENLEKAITDLLEHDDLCQQLSVQARRTYEEKYRLSAMRRNYQAMLKYL